MPKGLSAKHPMPISRHSQLSEIMENQSEHIIDIPSQTALLLAMGAKRLCMRGMREVSQRSGVFIKSYKFLPCSDLMSYKLFSWKNSFSLPCDPENFQKVTGNTNIFFLHLTTMSEALLRLLLPGRTSRDL